MKNLTAPHLSFGFVVTLLVLILNAGVAYQSISKISENNRLEVSCNNVLSIVANMLDTLKDLQMRQREYLLTNNPQYLASHRVEVTELRDRLKLLADPRNDRT
jgi:CHASE3 domain sensor protein